MSVGTAAAADILSGAESRQASAVGWWRGPWVRFVRRRLTRFAVAGFLLVTGAFAMIHAVPGDPVRAAMGRNTPAAVIAARRHSLGLDLPLWRQYVDYLHGLISGDLGISMTTQLPVKDMISQDLPATATLALYAFLVALLVALPLGITIGVLTRDDRHPRIQMAFSTTTGAFTAIPDFMLGVGLVFVFAVTLKWFPVAGRMGLSSYVLPVVSLGTGTAAVLTRIVRVETVRVLREDYMRTARSKRLPDRILYLRHALPNLLTSTLTLSGLALSSLLAGTVLVENVFAWPGLGTELVHSVPVKDYPMVQGLALVFGVGVLLINLIVDILIAVVDPRSTMLEN